MNIKNITDKLLNLYHNDFNSRTLMCWDINEIVINWYSDEYATVTINTDIKDKKEGIKFYDELCEYINFVDLAYELEELR